MKVKIWQGFAIDFSKELAPWDADGENVGILKFGRAEDAGSSNTWTP